MKPKLITLLFISCAVAQVAILIGRGASDGKTPARRQFLLGDTLVRLDGL
jgi:hypothetical protein